MGNLRGGVRLLGILRDSEGGLLEGSISLCGSSVRGTRREAPLLEIWKDMGRMAQGIGITPRRGPAGEPGRWLVNRELVKALETGISLHRGPTGETGRGLVYQGL